MASSSYGLKKYLSAGDWAYRFCRRHVVLWSCRFQRAIDGLSVVYVGALDGRGLFLSLMLLPLTMFS